MSGQEVYEKVVQILSPYARDKEALAQVSGDSKIIADLKINSSRLVDIILAFEDEFDIEVDDDEAREVQTVGKAVEMIGAKVS